MITSYMVTVGHKGTFSTFRFRWLPSVLLSLFVSGVIRDDFFHASIYFIGKKKAGIVLTTHSGWLVYAGRS